MCHTAIEAVTILPHSIGEGLVNQPKFMVTSFICFCLLGIGSSLMKEDREWSSHTSFGHSSCIALAKDFSPSTDLSLTLKHYLQFKNKASFFFTVMRWYRS